MSERVFDLTAGGYPERTYVGKNTTVADLAAHIAELEAENAKLRKCMGAADRMRLCPHTADADCSCLDKYDAARAEVDK